jgi:hypothetical protein
MPFEYGFKFAEKILLNARLLKCQCDRGSDCCSFNVTAKADSPVFMRPRNPYKKFNIIIFFSERLF